MEFPRSHPDIGLNEPKDPESLFELQKRIGEGFTWVSWFIYRSYGSVFRALHKNSNKIVAIKVIPVENDVHDMLQEIAILKFCHSPYIVRYYGSYYKDNDLWVGYGFLHDM